MKRKVGNNHNGYTLDELRYRMVVNRISSNIEKQQLLDIRQKSSINPFNPIGENSAIGYLEKFISILNYCEVMMKIFRRVRQIFKCVKQS